MGQLLSCSSVSRDSSSDLLSPNLEMVTMIRGCLIISRPIGIIPTLLELIFPI